MNPQLFLRTFWTMELRQQIFVAMSFDQRYVARFDRVIAPAIRGITIGGCSLEPYRVDLSKTGDSILADIIDGIAHCQMILADVSAMGKDSVTGEPYRNGNVMYEVGLALACRQPSEVLIVRDDHDKFLFDVSTIPHMTLDFTEPDKAKAKLESELVARLRTRTFFDDARIRLAVERLSSEEVTILTEVYNHPQDAIWGWPTPQAINFIVMAAIPRLLDKGLVAVAGAFEPGHPAYRFTPLGRVVAEIAIARLPRFKTETKEQKQTLGEKPETDAS
jgi:hypothetical protein